MRDKGLTFADALADAQRLGYAEADPTFDIEGVDAAHKITLLSALAFGIPVQFDRAHIEGITKLTAEDIRYAEELGYRIKLLGITKRKADGFELRVHPTLIPSKRLIANVEGVMNAVVVKGDAVGATLYYGRGAGAEPTASAVIADLVDVTRLHTADPEHRVPHLAFRADQLSDTPILPISEVESAYYLRLRVQDRPGVLADITRILADQGISIDAMLQKEPSGRRAAGQHHHADPRHPRKAGRCGHRSHRRAGQHRGRGHPPASGRAERLIGQRRAGVSRPASRPRSASGGKARRPCRCGPACRPAGGRH
jgi:homoserine dehydrogenase